MKMLLRLGVVLLGAIVLPMGATGCSTKENTKENVDHDLVLLQGEWTGMHFENPGGDLHLFKEGQLIIQGENVKLKFTKTESGFADGTVSLDPSKSPKTFDSEWHLNNGKVMHFNGIYKLEGSLLTVCFGLDELRPTGFKATEKPRSTVIVWGRAQ